jgi:hypothetical protein
LSEENCVRNISHRPRCTQHIRLLVPHLLCPTQANRFRKSEAKSVVWVVQQCSSERARRFGGTSQPQLEGTNKKSAEEANLRPVRLLLGLQLDSSSNWD